MKRSSLAFALLGSTLAGCSLFGTSNGTPTDMNSSSSMSSVYDAPSSVYLQGFVRVTQGPVPSVELVTPIGDTYTLLSSTVPLSTYAGNDVEVSGILSRNPDSGEQLLQVEEILIVVASSATSESSMSSEMSSSSESSISSAKSSAAVSSVAVSSKPAVVSSSSISSVKASSSAMAASSSASLGYSEEDVTKMARVRGADAWVQKYCSSHIGVCFPVRNDYWYTSFGATATSAWHVELGAKQLENIGEGPIAIDLLNSRIPDGVSDGAVVEANGMVTGYKTWTGNKHFAVTAPAALRASVEFIVQGFAPYETPVAP